MREYSKNNIEGKKFKNRDTGTDIGVYGKSIRHIMGRKSFLPLAQSVFAIPEMIKNAEYIRSMPDRKERSGIKAVHKYRCLLNISGKRFIASMTVFETIDEYKYYDHVLTVIKEIKKD